MFPIERLKELIAHPDKYIRAEVTRYIHVGGVRDAEIIPLVVAACEKYGCGECLRLLSCSAGQYVSPPMAEKLFALCMNGDLLAKLHLSSLIVHSDIEFVKSNIQRFKEIESFPCDVVDARIHYSDYAAEDIWNELEQYAKSEAAIETYSELNAARKDAVIERILHFGDVFDREICDRLNILADNIEYNEKSEWILNAVCIELAGLRNLVQSIHVLNEIMKNRRWDNYTSCARDSLAMIKSTEVIDVIKRDFLTQQWDYRLDAASIFGSYMGDYTVEAVDSLLKHRNKYENDIYGILCFSLCDQFSLKAFPWGMTVLGDREIARYDNMKERLWNLSQILDVNWAIVEKWEDEIKEKRQRDERILQNELALDNSDHATQAGLELSGDLLMSYLQSMLPQKGVSKIGRNDPCPCGSNKKYKKCCGKNI